MSTKISKQPKYKVFENINYSRLENNTVEILFDTQKTIPDSIWFQFFDEILQYPYKDNDSDKAAFELSNNLIITNQKNGKITKQFGLQVLKFNENVKIQDRAGYHDLLPKMIMNLDNMPIGINRGILIVDDLSRQEVLDEKSNKKIVRSSFEENAYKLIGFAAGDFARVVALGFHEISKRAAKGLADFMRALVVGNDVKSNINLLKYDKSVAENLVHLLFGYSRLKLIVPKNLVSSVGGGLFQLMRERVYRYTAHGGSNSGISEVINSILNESKNINS